MHCHMLLFFFVKSSMSNYSIFSVLPKISYAYMDSNAGKGLQLPMQSVPTTTKVVSSNPVHGEVYWIQHYVIKFVSDLRQVCGFHRVLLFSSTNLKSTIYCSTNNCNFIITYPLN